MGKIKEKNIETILPIKEIQEAMLLHHLYSENDAGFLLVEFRIKGLLDKNRFEKAWSQVVKRHEILRSSIHWENIKRPLQIVHKIGSPNFRFMDWSNLSKEQQGIELKSLKSKIRNVGVDFNKFPLLEFYIVQIDSDNHIFLWPSHHLLVDGWSTNNMVEDALEYYDSYLNNIEPNLNELPSLKSYVGWLKNKNPKEAASFWANYFEGFDGSKLIGSNGTKELSATEFSKNWILSIPETEALKNRAKNYKVSLSTIFQGAWGILLSLFLNKEDIVFGNAVSGRSNDFPNIELLAGMLMNVQPLRISSKNATSLAEWFREIQSRQMKALDFEHISQSEIMGIIDKQAENALFDSLLIIENFPWNDKKRGNLEILDFKSGITTNYPVTLVVVPDDQVRINFIFKGNRIDERIAQWFIESLSVILKSIADEQIESVKDISKLIERPIFDRINGTSKAIVGKSMFVPPKNELQLKLVGIWQEVLKIETIGINDNFFEIGGNSILSLQIIRKCSDSGIPITPNQLFKHQTIADLSDNLMQDIRPTYSYHHLVEIKATGTKAPLYCLFAGGMHVFLYDHLAKYIDPQRPVYVLQASPINAGLILHKSVEEMAIDFLSEIKRNQPNGPYHLMAYCFSTAVTLEISRILKERKEHVNFIVVDTIAEHRQLFTLSRTKIRLLSILNVLRNKPMGAFLGLIKKRIKNYLEPKLVKYQGTIEEKKIEKLRLNCLKIYNKYKWPTYSGKLTLIHTPLGGAVLISDVVNSWEKITQKENDVIRIEGTHWNVFAEPVVQKTAKVLDECMLKYENELDKISQ